MSRMREVVGRNPICPLCSARFDGRRSSFVHEKAGRVHLDCSLRGDRWKQWMQKTGQIPTPVDVEVVDG